eukprot:2166217-Pleurochrysis_carterae.AAC.2
MSLLLLFSQLNLENKHSKYGHHFKESAGRRYGWRYTTARCRCSLSSSLMLAEGAPPLPPLLLAESGCCSSTPSPSPLAAERRLRRHCSPRAERLPLLLPLSVTTVAWTTSSRLLAPRCCRHFHRIVAAGCRALPSPSRVAGLLGRRCLCRASPSSPLRAERWWLSLLLTLIVVATTSAERSRCSPRFEASSPYLAGHCCCSRSQYVVGASSLPSLAEYRFATRRILRCWCYRCWQRIVNAFASRLQTRYWSCVAIVAPSFTNLNNPSEFSTNFTKGRHRFNGRGAA